MEVAEIQKNLALLEGESPFIDLGGTLHLFTQIHRITATKFSDLGFAKIEEGYVSEINGSHAGADITVQDLVRLISAHYRRAQGSQE